MSHSNYYVFAPSPLGTRDFLQRFLVLLGDFHISLDDADPVRFSRRLSGLREGGKGFEVYATWTDARKPKNLLGEVAFLLRRRRKDRLGPSGIEVGFVDSDTYRITTSEHHFNQYVRFAIAGCERLRCERHYFTGDDCAPMRSATTDLLLKELPSARDLGAVLVTRQLYEEAKLTALLDRQARVWAVPSEHHELRLVCTNTDKLEPDDSWTKI